MINLVPFSLRLDVNVFLLDSQLVNLTMIGRGFRVASLMLRSGRLPPRRLLLSMQSCVNYSPSLLLHVARTPLWVSLFVSGML